MLLNTSYLLPAEWIMSFSAASVSSESAQSTFQGKAIYVPTINSVHRSLSRPESQLGFPCRYLDMEKHPLDLQLLEPSR